MRYVLNLSLDYKSAQTELEALKAFKQTSLCGKAEGTKSRRTGTGDLLGGLNQDGSCFRSDRRQTTWDFDI